MMIEESNSHPWPQKTLASITPDGAPILYGILQPGPNMPSGVPYVRPTEIASDTIDLDNIRRTTPEIAIRYKRSLLREGDIILSIVGTIGKVAIVPAPLDGGNITQSSVRIRVRPDIATPRFIAWALRSPILTQQYDQHRLGTAVPRLNVAHVRDLKVPVPPLEIQQRIVAEIEKQFTRLDAGVASLKRVQTALKRYRASVLKAACEGQFPHEPISVAIQSLDQGWSPKCESRPSPRDDVWAVIKTSAIQPGQFVQGENKRLPTTLQPRPHLELQRGDLLITRAGPRARAGVTCMIKSTRPRLMLCDKAYRIRTKPELADPAFLEIVLNAPHILDEIDDLKTGISDSGVNLTQKGFQELVIPLPQLAEQRRIVIETNRRISILEELESALLLTIQRTSGLRRSILRSVFSERR